MALINCNECNEKISDKAAACPRCGAELPKTKTRNLLTTIVVIGVILVAVFFAMDAMFSNNKRASADFEKALDDADNARRNAEDLTRRLNR